MSAIDLHTSSDEEVSLAADMLPEEPHDVNDSSNSSLDLDNRLVAMYNPSTVEGWAGGVLMASPSATDSSQLAQVDVLDDPATSLSDIIVDVHHGEFAVADEISSISSNEAIHRQAEYNANAERFMLERALEASLEISGQVASTSNANGAAVNESVGHDPKKSCVICFDVYTATHRFSCLPCGHLFGAACITTWLEEEDRRYCPTCKQPSTADNVLLLHG